MKSNISLQDINSGQKIIDKLLETNPRLLPFYLKSSIPQYLRFKPNIKKYGLWTSSIPSPQDQKYDKIIFLASGLAAAGKDSLFREITNLIPNMFYKTITATSRTPRPDEVNEIDYLFFQTDEFITSIKHNEFIEFIKRGETYYGLPKKSLDYAFNQSKPIIYCQIEMSGWSRLEKYLQSKKLKLLIIKGFIMPDMSISEYLNWLTCQRLKEDLESRIRKSGWEIQQAASKADIILTNRIREDSPTINYLARSVINYLIRTANLTNYPKLTTPTDSLTESQSLKIISAHDAIY